MDVYYGSEEETEGADCIIGIGHIVRQHFWGTAEQEDEEFEGLQHRDAARAKLGGFGFGGAHA